MTRFASVLLATLTIAAGISAGACVDASSDPDEDSFSVGGKADDATNDPPDCVFDRKDPFESHERIPAGAYKGRCYDTRSIRTAVRLDDVQAAQFGGRLPGELVVANVFHRDTFWVAHVPTAGVEAVLFQLEYFPAIVPAGHAQIRIRFRADAPVRLVGQTGKNTGRTTTLRDIVLSVEATGQIGYRYDIVRGVFDEFGTAYRITSLEAKLQHMIVEAHHDVEQWPLQLQPEEPQRLLENYASEATARRMQTMYNTLFVNCTNEAIRIIDQSVDYTVGEQIARFVAKVTEFYPNIVRAALIARGLLPLDNSTDWPLLADDPTVADLLAALR